MLILSELDPETGEYKICQESHNPQKLIESNGRKYIFRVPPKNVRPIFSPAPIVSTVSEAKRQKEEIRQLIKSLNLDDRRILQMMGCLNMYIYLTAKDWKAILKTKKDEVPNYQINPIPLKEMVAIADRGELENAFPITYALEYLSKHWHISCTRRSYWGVREFFRNYLSLFDFEPGIYQTRQISLYKQINYRRILLAYEVLEESLNEREKSDLLPEHLGSNVVNIYNAVFLGYLKYRRNWRFDLGAPIHEETMQHLTNKDIEKPEVRRLGNKPWCELTGKVLDSTKESWVSYFKTKDERDAYLSRQQEQVSKDSITS